MKPRTRRTSFLLLALLVFATSLTAATTGRLIGVVTDSSGAALPGVTVTLTSPQLLGTRTAITAADGGYEFPLLPPGRYRAEFTLAGLETKANDNITVALDQTTRSDASLGVGTVSEAIVVSADQVVVDPTQTTTQANFKEDHLKYASVGQAQRDYLAVLLQAPGVVEDTNGNPQVLGANSGQSAFVLDGVNSTDPVTHTFGTNLVFDSIQEISVQTLGKDAEYGKALGAVINVVTKSGGNNFSGSLDVRYTSDSLVEEGSRNRPDGEPRFDKELQQFENREPAVTLGGPIIRDRMWFFGAYSRPETANVAPTLFDFTPGSRDFNGWNAFAKVTWAPLSDQTLTLRYTGDNATIDHANFSSYYEPDADTLASQSTSIPTVSYDAVLNSRWLASAQLARVTNELSFGPYNGIDTTGSVDLATLIRSVNNSNYQARDSKRDQFIASTTYYLERFGSHAFKLGTDLEWNEFTSVNFLTGTPPDPSLCSEEWGYAPGSTCGAWLFTLNGEPYGVRIANRNPAETVESSARAFYVQDEWRPNQQLTARVGLRYERATFEPAGDQEVPDFELLQPRIGVAYDLFNNATSVLHGFYGKVMDDNALSLPSFLSPVGTLTTDFLLDHEGNWVPDSQSGGPSGNQVDPNLKPTHSDEYSFGFTQRILSNTSVDLTAVYRQTNDIFEDTCFDQDTCPFFWLTNAPNGDADALRSNYRGLIAKVETRPTSWLSGIVSYTVSKSRGSVEYTQNAGSDFDVAPDHFVNRYGYLSDDARHRVKINGYARLPLAIILGANYNWDSGTPWSVTRPSPYGGVEYLETRGSRRLPHYHRLDLQLQKDFRLGPVTAGLIAAVSNVLSTELPLAIDGNVGLNGTIDSPTNANFGNAVSWQIPRRYDIGVRFEF
ncbi:MAG TPA: TonB-dependent receptor [Thermoanaerobaculia bacterium]